MGTGGQHDPLVHERGATITTHQKLESSAVTFCYPVSRTLETLSQNSLTQKSEHSRCFL